MVVVSIAASICPGDTGLIKLRKERPLRAKGAPPLPRSMWDLPMRQTDAPPSESERPKSPETDAPSRESERPESAEPTSQKGPEKENMCRLCKKEKAMPPGRRCKHCTRLYERVRKAAKRSRGEGYIEAFTP